eukprot:2045767-Pleurochrysis_carterae.AAC.1
MGLNSVVSLSGFGAERENSTRGNGDFAYARKPRECGVLGGADQGGRTIASVGVARLRASPVGSGSRVCGGEGASGKEREPDVEMAAGGQGGVFCGDDRWGTEFGSLRTGGGWMKQRDEKRMVDNAADGRQLDGHSKQERCARMSLSVAGGMGCSRIVDTQALSMPPNDEMFCRYCTLATACARCSLKFQQLQCTGLLS